MSNRRRQIRQSATLIRHCKRLSTSPPSLAHTLVAVFSNLANNYHDGGFRVASHMPIKYAWNCQQEIKKSQLLVFEIEWRLRDSSY